MEFDKTMSFKVEREQNVKCQEILKEVYVALEEKGFVVRENDVVIVSVPDKPNGLNSVLEVLDEKDINLEYMYAFISNKTDEAIVVMRFENMEEAVELLKDSDVNILEKEDIEKL